MPTVPGENAQQAVVEVEELLFRARCDVSEALSPSTCASRRSSLAPATVNRSRNRSSCLGLIAKTANPRSSSISTIGPCGVSIATPMRAGGAAVWR